MSLNEIFKLLKEESKTARQAKKMGLTYAGRGYWKDSSGKTVAKTLDGKLVRVNHNEVPEPKTHREPAAPRGRPRKIAKDEGRGHPMKYTKIDPQEYAAAQRIISDLRRALRPELQGSSGGGIENMTYEPIYDKNPTAYHERFHDVDWYTETIPPAVSKAFRQAFNAINHPIGIDTLVDLVMNVDPMESTRFDDPDLDQPHQLTGAKCLGVHSTYYRRTYLSKETTDGLYRMCHWTEKDFESLWRAMNTGSYGKLFDDPVIFSALSALHTIIHEKVHAKDSYLHKKAREFKDTPENFIRDQPILEGLTEYRAQKIMDELVFQRRRYEKKLMDRDNMPHDPRGVWLYFGAYPQFVNGIDFMEERRPGTAAALWKIQDGQQRIDYVNKVLDECFQDLLTKMENSEFGEGCVDDFLEFMGDETSYDKLFKTGTLKYVALAMEKVVQTPGKYSWTKTPEDRRIKFRNVLEAAKESSTRAAHVFYSGW